MFPLILKCSFSELSCSNEALGSLPQKSNWSGQKRSATSENLQSGEDLLHLLHISCVSDCLASFPYFGPDFLHLQFPQSHVPSLVQFFNFEPSPNPVVQKRRGAVRLTRAFGGRRAGAAAATGAGQQVAGWLSYRPRYVYLKNKTDCVPRKVTNR